MVLTRSDIMKTLPVKDIGNYPLEYSKLKKLEIYCGIIDAKGRYHSLNNRNEILKETGIGIAHEELAQFLAKQNCIKEDYIRVADFGYKNGAFLSQSLGYTSNSNNDFLLTPEMAVALYNGMQSQDPDDTFEKNFVNRGFFFGFWQDEPGQSKKIEPEREGVLNRNLDVLQDVLGKKLFDKKSFMNNLER